ncbi:MAG: DoxX family protein [Nannocystaceae bacterium]|nr:DoxX family protein [Nannocystaceae bacterium]
MNPTHKNLHRGLWAAQLLTAAAFFMGGAFKTFTPGAELAAAGMAAPLTVLRIAGISELLGAAGLLLPAGLRIAPRLTPIAAAALTLVMVLAFLTHALAGDFGGAVPSVVLGAITAFIAWGRSTKAPIAPKNT